MKYIGKKGQLYIGQHPVNPGDDIEDESIVKRYPAFFEKPKASKPKKIETKKDEE